LHIFYNPPSPKYQHPLAVILYPLSKLFFFLTKKKPFSNPSTASHPNYYYNGSLEGWTHF